MATCADCIHYEVCSDYFDATIECGSTCSFWKDRSRFMELPCKDGEYVYAIEPLCDSMAFHTIKHRKIKHIEPQARIQFAGGGWILDFLSAFNQYVFRTYEEAEQALKGREKMPEKLKPCPFCGSKSVRRQGGVITGMVTFVCQCCGADVCFYGAERDPHATQAWNRRIDNAK